MSPGGFVGIDLPQRWRGRGRFVVLDTAFGLGDSFFATWQAWREDPERCARLVFIATCAQPPSCDDLRAAGRDGLQVDLVDALLRAWPPLTPDLHRLSFEAGRVELLLALGDTQAWLRELVAEVDAFNIDGGAAVDAERVCKSIGRLAAPGATLVATAVNDGWRAHLATAGFEVVGASRPANEVDPGDPICARFAPAFTRRRALSRLRGRAAIEPHALVVGAGLAGCAAAWALAEHGWRSTLLERRPQIASEASGNPAGLFHGIVNAQDGVHARFNRAAALATHPAVQAALNRGVPGRADGVLRLETSLDVPQMRALLQSVGLPPGYVQALSAREASARADLPLAHPCWFYPGGGWVQPGGLARTFLERAGALAEVRATADAHALQRTPSGWRVLDAHGHTLGEAQTLVLANAGDALRLLGAPDWPIDAVRGQISVGDASQLSAPNLPIAGSGYLLPAVDGRVMFGATAQRDDTDPSVRAADHTLNLAQLARLLGHPTALDPTSLEGRTAWRCSAVDRLPVIGAVPDPDARGARLDQPRFVPRLPGLYVFSALGSRGITWSALGAQVLASWVTGAPAPVGASLLDAVDPARFVSRRVRRATSG